ncbi:ATP-binding protein [Pseudomonas oryzihabitans]|uniref:ATP-binding protein n=1 Tax=Pseudomonas oryzihabitans TaxID=47885 RepID=UPI00214DFBFC|nr:ATP-binding protein [Pseudomonas psychrotolerans]UUW71057.1 putative DNA binding domain-containing protein [Pseudomonas psychrotolerans]
MVVENEEFDRKSLRKVQGKQAAWTEVAVDCVAFANSAGGRLLIGIEDSCDLPPAEQRIAPVLLDQIRKRIQELTVNVAVVPRLVVAENQGEYIELNIARSFGIASTTDGRYFMRVGDSCVPIVGDQVLQLLNDRPTLPWETLTHLRVSRREIDPLQVAFIVGGLRRSDRVKSGLKEKSDSELLEHYGLVDGDYLTNLGVLFLGHARDRAKLGSAPLVQVLKYDELGNKINKWHWSDYHSNPIELVEAIWREVPDFRESYELPDGLYRQHVPAFDERVVRELLVNALVHRPYTQRGDLYLNLYPDRLEVVNPGRLPLGVTPANILHASRRRNDRMAVLFHDLQLMEKEGTGFDLIYDVQLSNGRPAPELYERVDAVCVIIRRRIVRPEMIGLLKTLDERFMLTRRERITLGLLAQHEGLTSTELAASLELSATDELKPWIGRLRDLGLVEETGRTKAKRYYVSPTWLRGSGLEGVTTLTRIEPHRLRALIIEDLGRYPGSSSSEINQRIGVEISDRTVKRALDELIQQSQVRFEGERRWRRYWLGESS